MDFVKKIKNFLLSVCREQWLGYALLLMSFFISLINFQNGVFVDEEDNLLMGSFILKGFLPYRDIFSHHFPFAYFWTSFVYLFSNDSILLARLSITLFQISVFLISMHLSGNYLVFGFVSLVWSVLKIYYWGNMVLYHSLAAPLATCVFLLTYLILISYSIPTWKHALVLAIFSVLLILLTPFTVYGLFFVYLSLFIKNRKFVFESLKIMLLFFLVFVLYLILTGSFMDFVDQAVLFNLNIYNKYNSFLREQTQGGLLSVLGNIHNFLGIGNRDWYNFDLYKPLVLNYSDIDKWIFTGFHYRIAWIILFFGSLFERKYLAAFFSLFFGASLLSIGQWGFHGQPFILTSIAVSTTVILTSIRRGNKGGLTSYIFTSVSGVILLFFMMWLSFRLVENINTPSIYKSYRNYYGEHIEIANKIRKWTCNRKDVKLLYYPAGYRQYFFTGLLPLTKYTALYPWIADIAQDDIIQALQNENVFVIVYIEPIDVWGIKVEEYLRPMIGFLKSRYKQIDDWVFVSPALYSACPVLIQEIDIN